MNGQATYRFNDCALPERVLIMSTIPLTEKRYVTEKKRAGFSFFQTKSDFLHTQFFADMRWNTYQSEVAIPVLAELNRIRQYSAVVIDYDCSFHDFKKAVSSGLFDSVFVVAHHIEQTDSIEFAGGSKPFSSVTGFLVNELPESHMNMHFIVCNGDRFKTLKDQTLNYAGTVSFGFWSFPVIESYVFIRHWVLQLDGKRTLQEAYTLAIGMYKQHLNSTT